MNGINKLKTLFIFFISLSLLSCESEVMVNYESKKYEEFVSNENTQELPDEFYINRLHLVSNVDIVVQRFSRYYDFEDIIVENLVILDDCNHVLFKKDNAKLTAYDSIDTLREFNRKVYYYQIKDDEFEFDKLNEHGPKSVLLIYEIKGVKYSEELYRDEKRYLLLPT